MRRCTTIVLCLVWCLAACGANSTTPTAAPTTIAQLNKPTLSLLSPAEGTTTPQGSEVSVRSTASDSHGVTRVELWVDGVLYRADITREAEGLPTVTVTQKWPAKDLGSHTLQVKALNRDGGASDAQIVHITVVPSDAVPSATASAQPTSVTPPVTTATPNATATTATTAAPAACEDNAAFVADVSVPDNSPFKPGDPINKVWRVRNTGKCDWGDGYQLVFVDGSQMGGINTAAARTSVGGTADISVNMVAPRAPGTYTGRWRMRAPGGSLFGQALLVIIRVIDLNPTPSVTATPPQPS